MIFVFGLLFPSCATRSGGDVTTAQLFEQGVVALQKEQFSLAHERFEAFLRREPVSKLSLAAQFNLGLSLEGMGKCQQAQEIYRSVVRASNLHPRLQASALYQMSFCLEAAGDDVRLVAALGDARRRRAYLEPGIGEAELPARLAAAHMRLGNQNEALKNYQQSQIGITRLRAQFVDQELPEWLKRVYFMMGQVSRRPITIENFKSELVVWRPAQLNLLQAVEIGKEPWAQKSATLLLSRYRDFWGVIEKFEQESSVNEADEVLKDQERQARRLELLEPFLLTIKSLRSARLPEEASRSTSLLEELFALLQGYEDKAKVHFEEPILRSQLTPDAKEKKQRQSQPATSLPTAPDGQE